MDSESKIFVIVVIFAGVILGGMVIVPALMGPASEAATSGSATPNLYELTRQTAANTSHIFWLIVVCFTAWSIRSYKTGK